MKQCQMVWTRNSNESPKKVLTDLQIMTVSEWIKNINILGTRSIQGDPKKMSHSVFELKFVLDAGFDFSACVLESESRARFISPL